MRPAICLALFLSSPAFASDEAKPGIFFTAHFGTGTTVSLRLAENSISRDAAFDFDVIINVSEADGTGTLLYSDHSRHLATVRCLGPATVRVGTVDYVIDGAQTPGEDWKHDLWAYLCTPPLS